MKQITKLFSFAFNTVADGRTSASAKVSTKMLSQINPI